jgi:hypothetical protein
MHIGRWVSRRVLLGGLGALSFVSTPGWLAAARRRGGTSRSAEYRFTPQNPPLLKDYGTRVLQIPAEALQSMKGPAQWTNLEDHRLNWAYEEVPGESKEYDGPRDKTKEPDDVKLVRRIVTEFKLSRKLQWRMDGNLRTLAVDEKLTNSRRQGYDKTQKQTFSQALEVNAGASGFGLSIGVKEILGLADETTDHWVEEHTETRERTWLGGFTYLSWSLVDTLILDKKRTEWKMSVVGEATTSSTQQFEVVVRIVEDSVSSKKLGYSE